MKKTIFTAMIVGSIFAQTAFADPIFFTTIAEAQKYCPPLSAANYDLYFKPNNPVVPNSAGVISGTSQSGVSFSSGNTQLQPLNWDIATGIVQDAQFRSVSGNYGYISGNQITCYYSYTSFNNVLVNLILQGKN